MVVECISMAKSLRDSKDILIFFFLHLDIIESVL